MSERDPSGVAFEGEEAGTGYASPFLDLVATAVLVAVSVGFMVASLRLDVPGGLATAPGLLPFLVSLSLLFMALALGASAYYRWRSGEAFFWEPETDAVTGLRTIALGIAVAAYIAALQVFAFQQQVSIAGYPFRVTAFEPVTLLALSVIIHMFWRGPVWVTVAVSAAWTITLSLVFQKVFNIPLPGSW